MSNSTLADRRFDSYLALIDKNKRMRYCGITEAIALVGERELGRLMQENEVRYTNKRTDCASNASYRFRRIDIIRHVRAVKDADKYLQSVI